MFKAGLNEGLELTVSGFTQNERLVYGVDVRVDELGGKCVSSGDNNGLSVHDISLESASDNSIDMFPGGNDDLASHMTTLFVSGSLILDVDSSSAILNHQLD